ncbi:CGNR zinc finger domain-containing protein [Prauserella sp. ASG 168]|uniref:CGNR zinc finger domain-containing protein n=2 Tax=Prauserella cavernicola TaxID=2800127 RepID=A0A934QPH7_9PSEU|nr:CGNR zinc finger domain-containing protein [Prauserella cavernicola]
MDTLATESGWLTWARERSLRADSLADAVHARQSLRAAVGDPDATPGEVRAPVEVALTADGPALAPSTAVGAVFAAAARLAVLGDWPRVKICPADDCRWAFYDESRNRSRTWCSMKVCGNRQKARAFRERSTERPACG